MKGGLASVSGAKVETDKQDGRETAFFGDVSCKGDGKAQLVQPKRSHAGSTCAGKV